VGADEMTFTWSELPTQTAAETPAVSIFVVSTSSKLFRPAVSSARQLTREFGGEIVVLAPHVVPYPLDLTHPPVAPAFLESRFVCDHGPLPDIENVRILLCRDEAEAILGALEPKSIVVMGTKKRCWRTRDEAIIERLRSAGHQVVIAYA
jgi:hypothetical protein